jgi:hypothetical protein
MQYPTAFEPNKKKFMYTARIHLMPAFLIFNALPMAPDA